MNYGEEETDSKKTAQTCNSTVLLLPLFLRRTACFVLLPGKEMSHDKATVLPLTFNTYIL